jgi:hypothetical protein
MRKLTRYYRDKGLNVTAIRHNSRVAESHYNFGPEKFKVYHVGAVTVWGAQSREHLDLLLRIEVNMGYIKSITKIEKQNHHAT